MVDDPALEGEEVDRPGALGPLNGLAGDRQGEAPVVAARDPGGQPCRTRRGLQHSLNGARMAGLQRGLVRRPDREAQAQRQLVRYAHLGAAHQKQGRDRQVQNPARLGVGGHGDRHRQIDHVRIAIVHQTRERLPLRQGPDDLARLEAIGQAPVQGGGPARISGIAPIGMPVRLDVLTHGQDQRRAGRRARGHGDQFGRDPFGRGRTDGRRGVLRRDRHGHQRQPAPDQEGEQASHKGSRSPQPRHPDPRQQSIWAYPRQGRADRSRPGALCDGRSRLAARGRVHDDLGAATQRLGCAIGSDRSGVALDRDLERRQGPALGLERLGDGDRAPL